MTESFQDKPRLLVKVSTLYYADGLNQQQIAERLGISRPQISRMLAAAKAEGIVQITIRNPFSEEQVYERAISEVFGLRDVLVVQVPDADQDQQLIDLHVAREAASFLEGVIRDRDIVGVMAGRTIASVGGALHYSVKKDVKFVPLVGGWGAEGASWHANSNTRLFAERLKARYLLLNAPAIVASRQTRDLFVREPEIADVLNCAKQATIALVGIGQVSRKATIVESGYFDRQNIEDVRALGALSNICTSFLDANGRDVPHEAALRMIGISVAELRRIPNVIAVASGRDKTEAIVSALRGSCIHALVTDMATARRLLDWHRSHPHIDK
ncbi:sugar-binding transcriptional regulator [Paenibacillus piri]|uniref:Sugar-binding transcriptional regulator n=1 Tax=Paenibacillus piri TaxID=2547395 RepID=A0A4R5KSJ0_9BACL|nr:sugar-binding transcriptional regulator [Paenibacillus piri]TDF98586.1 sugar-binding transcriptional regulator [Paenibacillus piri]